MRLKALEVVIMPIQLSSRAGDLLIQCLFRMVLSSSVLASSATSGCDVHYRPFHVLRVAVYTTMS